MSDRKSIAVVAASSAVPQIELAAGVRLLREEGFEVFCHPVCEQQHFTFAGNDEERARAYFECAMDPRFDVIWCASGGYGATRILPLLDEMARERGIPRCKLLVGYSDVTALHHYARTRWGWRTLHAPMVSTLALPTVDRPTLSAVMECVRGRAAGNPWGEASLAFVGDRPALGIRGRLVGGNLCVWAAMQGTPYAPRAQRDQVLFFEDVNEPIYRIDRMVNQIRQAGGLEVGAIVLGDFTNCKDEVTQVLAGDAEAGYRKAPLREAIPTREALMEIFGDVGRQLGLTVAMGLPVGHGPNYRPLPLGALVELSPEGRLSLVEWDGTTG